MMKTDTSVKQWLSESKLRSISKASFLLAKSKLLRFVISSGLLKTYLNNQSKVRDIWDQKIELFKEERTRLIQSSSKSEMDKELSYDSYSGLLKLNLILDQLSDHKESSDSVLDKLGRAGGFLSALLHIHDRETAYFLTIYIILELLAILIEEDQMKLRLKSMLSDMRNELKLSQDAIGYYTGLFRLDELLIPYPQDTDPKALDRTYQSIVRHSLK